MNAETPPEANGSLIRFVRQFRRPYASMLLATCLGACLIVGAATGNWIPGALAWPIVAVIGVDGGYRMVEKIREVET